jgi:hypothetical protein
MRGFGCCWQAAVLTAAVPYSGSSYCCCTLQRQFLLLLYLNVRVRQGIARATIEGHGGTAIALLVVNHSATASIIHDGLIMDAQTSRVDGKILLLASGKIAGFCAELSACRNL